MAITFVAKTEGAAVITQGYTLSEPAGVQQGDLLIAHIAYRSTDGNGYATPTGWTLIKQATSASTATNTSALASSATFYCIRGASAPTFTFTKNTTAPNVAMGCVVAYRGVDNTTPLRGPGGIFFDATGTTTINYFSGTNTTPETDDLVVAWAAGGQEATFSDLRVGSGGSSTGWTGTSTATDVTTDPASGTFVERAEAVTTTGADTSFSIADALVPSGVTNINGVLATASIAARHVVGFQVFKPAATGPTPLTANNTSYSVSYGNTGLRVGRKLSTISVGTNPKFSGGGSNYSLSGGDLIATWDNLTGTTARTDIGSTTGETKYIEFAWGGSGSFQRFGLCTSAHSLITYPGATTSSIAVRESGVVEQNAATVTTIMSFTGSNRGQLAWNDTNVWFRVDGGNWNNSGTANPATNTGGIAHGLTGTIYACGSSIGTGNTLTIKGTAADWSNSAPSGFTQLGTAGGPATYSISTINTTIIKGKTPLLATVSAFAVATNGNLLFDQASANSGMTVINGGLGITETSGAYVFKNARATIGKTSGQKRIFSVRVTTASAGATKFVGLCTSVPTSSNFLGSNTTSIGYYDGGTWYYNNSSTAGLTSWSQGSLITVAYDDTYVWFKKDTGNWNNNVSADPATATGGIAHNLSGTIYPAVSLYQLNDVMNLEAPASIPSGFSTFETEWTKLKLARKLNAYGGTSYIDAYGPNGYVTGNGLTLNAQSFTELAGRINKPFTIGGSAIQYEVLVGGVVGAASVGMCKSTHDLSTYIGGSADSIGLYPNGFVYKNGGIVADINASYAAGDVVAVRVDSTFIYFKINAGSWNSVAHGMTGTLYPAASVYNTANFTFRMKASSWSTSALSSPLEAESYVTAFSNTIIKKAYAALVASVAGFSIQSGTIQPFDPASSDANLSFSNGNRTISKTVTSTHSTARGLDGLTTGQKKVFAVNVTSNGGSVMLGFGTSTPGDGNYLGQGGTQVGWDSFGGVFKTSNQIGSAQAFTTGIRHIAYTDSHAWFLGPNGLWNNDAGADPATATGGIAHGLTGTIYPMVALFAVGSDSATLVSPTVVPSGFTPFVDGWTSLRAARKLPANLQTYTASFTDTTLTYSQLDRTLTASVSEYAITLGSTALRLGRKLAATNLPVNVSFVSTTSLRFGRRLLATVRPIAVAYPSTGVRKGFRLAGTVTAYNAAYTSTGFRRGLKIVATPVSYAVTGYDIGFLGVGNKLLNASLTTYAAATTNTTLRVARKSALTVTAYTSTYTSTAIRAGRKVVATVRAITVTPTSMLLRATRRLLATVSARTIAVSSTAVRAGRKLGISVLPLSVAMTTTTLKLNRRLTASTQSYTVGTTSTGMSYTRKLTAVTTAYNVVVTETNITFAVNPNNGKFFLFY